MTFELQALIRQAVYECRTCGETDYGERGGPGHTDCQTLCKHRA